MEEWTSPELCHNRFSKSNNYGWTHRQSRFICSFTKCKWHHHGGEHYWLACLRIVWWRSSALDYISAKGKSRPLCISILAFVEYKLENKQKTFFKQAMEKHEMPILNCEWVCPLLNMRLVRYHTALHYWMKPIGMLQILSKFLSSYYTKCRWFFC